MLSRLFITLVVLSILLTVLMLHFTHIFTCAFSNTAIKNTENNEDNRDNIILYILLAIIFTIYSLHRPKLKTSKEVKKAP